MDCVLAGKVAACNHQERHRTAFEQATAATHGAATLYQRCEGLRRLGARLSPSTLQILVLLMHCHGQFDPPTGTTAPASEVHRRVARSTPMKQLISMPTMTCNPKRRPGRTFAQRTIAPTVFGQVVALMPVPQILRNAANTCGILYLSKVYI